MFIVNDDLDAWAVFGAGDETFSYYYLWTPDNNICIMYPDESSDVPALYITEVPEAGPCPYIEEQGWDYTYVTLDENQEPVSIIGPWGYEWMFKDEMEFAEEYPTYLMDFYQYQSEEQGYYEEITPVWYNFIVSEELYSWAVIATYDPAFNKFYLWTPDDNTCALYPDWISENPEDGVNGFFVDYEPGYSCPYIDE